MKQLFLFLLFIGVGIPKNLAQVITVDDQRSAQNLVEDVLINNTGCASVFNFQVSGGDFGSGEESFGYFDASNTIFPFTEGIILSTGRALDAPGPNLSNNSTQSITIWPGLDNTSANILQQTNTFNATSLEFDFIPLSNFMSFEYIFASEEYINIFMCDFSDVFGFFIKEVNAPDSDYVNIALVPNTTTPISVTNVHPEGPCPAINEAYFNEFNGFQYPIDFNGQTVPLLAQSDVIAGLTYHIKLIIADEGDKQLDSAVFLKANSFDIGLNLGRDRLKVNGNALCEGESLVLDAKINATSFQWSKFNETTQLFDLILGANQQTFTITPSLGEGVYRVELDLGSGCLSETQIIVEYDTFPLLSDATLITCINDNSSFASINLFNAFELVNNGNESLIINGFYNRFDEAVDNINLISNPNSYNNISQNEIVFVSIRNSSGCSSVAQIMLVVYQNPKIKADEIDYYCLNEFPNVKSIESGFINGIESDYNFKWFLFNDNTMVFKEVIGENNDIINIDKIGLYKVEITNANNCTVSREIRILASSSPIIKNVIQTENEFFEKVSLIVTVAGIGNYQFALDIDSLNIDNEVFYQDINIFEFVTYGLHKLYVRDKGLCGIVEKDILILKYSKFFTPNNDGINDRWNIDNINNYINLNLILPKINTVSNIIIYDRFGKIIANINPNGLGWDGKFNGKLLPETSYWFTVNLIDFKGKVYTKKGHFSLQL